MTDADAARIAERYPEEGYREIALTCMGFRNGKQPTHSHMAQIAALEIENTKLREALRAVEWCAYDETSPSKLDYRLCPECSNRETEGHAPCCKIHAALTPEALDA